MIKEKWTREEVRERIKEIIEQTIERSAFEISNSKKFVDIRINKKYAKMNNSRVAKLTRIIDEFLKE